MTSTGKLDRRALPDLVARADRAVADDYATDRQREIAAMWTQVTGQPPSSVDEDFLACGGDSLAGARLLARLAARWGVRVSFAEFLDHATVAQLAALVDRIAAR